MKKPNKTNKIDPINSKDFSLSAHKFSQFHADIPSGISPDDLEDDRYWVNVSNKINIYDEIRAVAEDGSFYARLLVLSKRGLELTVKIIELVWLESDEDKKLGDQDRYQIKWRGPKKWSLVDTENNTIIRDEIPNKKEALDLFEEYTGFIKE